MGKEQIVVGLEIGTSKVTAVVGDIKADGTVKILGAWARRFRAACARARS